ncbi:MAG: bacteriocin [Clostridia bacterium]|nr:bacteriocin [Clostridia bacterium]
MELWKEIISIVVSNGVFAILFVWLFMYQLKDSSKREKKYQDTISQLTSHLNTFEDMKKDINDIKELLREEDESEELL